MGYTVVWLLVINGQFRIYEPHDVKRGLPTILKFYMKKNKIWLWTLVNWAFYTELHGNFAAPLQRGCEWQKSFMKS